MRLAVVSRVDQIEAAEGTAIDGATRDLIGGIPFSKVAHRRHVPAIGMVTP